MFYCVIGFHCSSGSVFGNSRVKNTSVSLMSYDLILSFTIRPQTDV